LTEAEDDTDLDALREIFDTNGDDRLNSEDADWTQFKIWRDSNQNGVVDGGELMTLDEIGITELSLLTREGTSQILSDGTVNHGLIDVTMDDGTVVDGGDIAFAFEQNGERQTIDETGQTVIEYETAAGPSHDGAVSFTFGDYSQVVSHLQTMGFKDDAVAALEFAEQDGDNVVIKNDGVTVVTIEDSTIDVLREALSQELSDPDQMFAYDGDMFEFDEEADGDAPDGDNTAALTAQAVAESEQNTPSDSEETLADASDAAVEPTPTESDQPTETVNEDGA
jgi:hypothetical protein